MLDVVGSSEMIEQWPVPLSQLPATPGWRRSRPRFETMAMLSGGLSSHCGSLLGVLLAGCCDQGLGRPVLRPLWAEEAMHRAYSMVRLVAARSRCDGPVFPAQLGASVELVLAGDLAAQFQSLDGANDVVILSCSSVLRDVVCDLDALFGIVAGEITLRTDIERIALPAYKRRALVLAAAELHANALLHAFRGRERGQVAVTLKSVGPGLASLRVTDDGVGFTDGYPDLQGGIAAGLADLLEGDLSHQRIHGQTTAEIMFHV